MSKDTYMQSFTVPQHWCDMNNRVTAGYILKISQDIATAHCSENGIDGKVYEDTHTAFLLAKSQILQTRPIIWGDNIKVVTEAFGPVRATFLRTISFFNQENELLVKVNSLWFLIDTDTKRIVRRAPQEILSFFTNPQECSAQIQISKTDAELVSRSKASFSMCDKNRHINNTVYADIVFDNLPEDIAQISDFSEMCLVYHNEIPYESTFEILRGKYDDNSYYFLGQNEEKKYFEASIVFSHNINNCF